ncbi:molybdopterin-dependent oxidoreductase [Flavimaricola marinus]|uniref:Dimethyl sulfoxide/trimethylamine N-oxide reductase n=1 Tax=Flavimaricola marinus TaxID=1819565 RepID=A0A238LFB2_9RHOB|nr:molybdopterin-dependent oxidoreductase [Flavimaricola marinus]SMY08094.1 Dimethyl sulfoxide/trimethylamine N-oxide reductase precursor [Flavimaricola marinus]
MGQKYTAAHWGSYRLAGEGEDLSLTPVDTDLNPSRIGRGWVSAMRNSDARIARPSIREGWLKHRDHDRSGDAVFREVPWDEALDMLAEELRRVIDTHGNEAIYAGSYGWASAGRFHHAQSQLRRFLNGIGGYVSSRDTYSHAAAEVLFPFVVGMSLNAVQDQTTSWSSVAEHCELFVAFGGVSARTAQVSSAGTTTHEVETWMGRARANGMACVNVSPLATDLPGAEWLAIRPGTDTALILALAHEIFAAGLADRDFLARYTHGADRFETYVMGTDDGLPKTAEWAAQICDVSAEAIRALAARMAKSRTMIAVTWSLQRADHGEQAMWAALALAAMLGQIGQPGTGYGFGYGCTTPVGRPARLVPWPSVPQGQNRVTDFIPVARVADMLEAPGAPYTYAGTDRTYPDARLVWWAGGNPFHHHQDLQRLDAAWRRPETVVVMDHSWTATARRADFVLPTTSPLERDDLMLNRRDAGLIYMSAAMPQFAEARDDYAILAGLAERMGTADAFTKGRSVDEWLRHLWERCAPVAKVAGLDLPAFDDFRREGMIRVPDEEQAKVLFADFVADPEAHPLPTESGKIDIFSPKIADADLPDCPAHPTWLEPVEWLGAAAEDELHLLSIQPDTRLHAQLDQGSEALASKIEGREVCTMHPDAAAARGLTAGDIVLLENARGACLAGLALSDQMRPDCVILPTGAWLDLQEIDGRMICVSGNVNVLTIDKGTSGLGQGNIAHTALVRVRKWDKPLPELRVTKPPRFA